MNELQVLPDSEDHAAAIETLLLLADAGAAWHEYDHACDLLEIVEATGARLPAEYELKRRCWTLDADRALAGSRR